MKYKISILIASFTVAFIFITVGYSQWETRFVIKGHITVNRPEVIEKVIPKEVPPESTDLAGQDEKNHMLEGKETNEVAADNVVDNSVTDSAIINSAVTNSAITNGQSENSAIASEEEPDNGTSSSGPSIAVPESQQEEESEERNSGSEVIIPLTDTQISEELDEGIN